MLNMFKIHSLHVFMTQLTNQIAQLYMLLQIHANDTCIQALKVNYIIIMCLEQTYVCLYGKNFLQFNLQL